VCANARKAGVRLAIDRCLLFFDFLGDDYAPTNPNDPDRKSVCDHPFKRNPSISARGQASFIYAACNGTAGEFFQLLR
jgi:hypothetical protein